eukprot:jgi/Bigna1/90136/estExt_fgenesh1_pg.C_630046
MKTENKITNIAKTFSSEGLWTCARLCFQGSIAELKDFATARFPRFSFHSKMEKDELVQALKKQAMDAVTVRSLKDCCRKYGIKGYSGKNKGKLGQMIFDEATCSIQRKSNNELMESDSESDSDDEPMESDSESDSDYEPMESDFESDSDYEPMESDSDDEDEPIIRITNVLLLLLLLYQAKLGSYEDSKGQENGEEAEKFERFLKEARLSEFVQTLREAGYEYIDDLPEMDSDEKEKFFPKKPHRRRFEKAIKEMKKTTSVKPSKKPKPVIDHKFALIIGNGKYRKGPLGSNPINDAQVIRNKFESEYGYKVFYHENLKSKDMKDALYKFEKALKNAIKGGGESLAVVFFAGHGVLTTTANGLSENLLLGIDNVGYEDERDLQVKELSTKDVVTALEEAKVSMKIMLLDCCREVSGMPLSVVSKSRSLAKSGLKIPREEVKGCMILYAFQPGKLTSNGDYEKKNGLFTESLMEAFKSRKNERNPPTFCDLVSEAGKIMEHHNQQPAVEISCVGQSIYMCIDGTHFKDWHTLP